MIGGGCVVAIILYYNWLFAFSFLPLTEGWFSAYGQLIRGGSVPYRDFYLYLTPLYPMLMAGFSEIFGNGLFVLRSVGVALVLGIALLLYAILSRGFRPATSAVASTAACIYYQSGVAHIPYDFIQFVTFFTLASTLMLLMAFHRVEEGGVGPSNRNVDPAFKLFLAGLFSSLAFLIKQSNGVFICAATFGVCLCQSYCYGRRGWRLIASFCLGGLLPVLALALWLSYKGALTDCIDQIFLGAMAAKGSADAILLSWLRGLMSGSSAHQLFEAGKIIVFLLGASWALRIVMREHGVTMRQYINGPVVLASLTIALIGVLAATYYSGKNAFAYLVGSMLDELIIVVALLLAAGLGMLGGLPLVSRTVPKGRFGFLGVVGVVSLGMIWGNGTSAGLSEVGTFVMLAVALALLAEGKAIRFAGKPVALLFAICLIHYYAESKFEVPYAWWGLTQSDVRHARDSSKAPLADGLRLSADTAELVDKLSRAVKQAGPVESVFAFPNIPIVYLMAEKFPDSKVIVSWFDFLPDQPARTEAVRLVTTPPSLIANLRIPSSVWTAHERLFRDGKPLGQRDVQRAIGELTQRPGQYSLVLRHSVAQGMILEIWQRVER